jgi:PAS domain S-box-containing protein
VRKVDPVSPENVRHRWELFALVLLLLALLLGALHSLSSSSRTTGWLNHTNEVRVSVGRLRSMMLDAETGARGYAMTGEREFREPYDRALSDWRPELDRVRYLTTDNPDQQQRLERLEHLLRQSLDSLSLLRGAYEVGDRGRGLMPIMRQGKRGMDAARAVIGEIEQEEARLDSVRQLDASRRWQRTMVLLVGGGFAVFLVVGVIWMQRRNDQIRRQVIDGERSLLQAVLAGIEDGITLQDRTGKLIFANASAARLIGFASPQELLAASIPEIMQRFEVFDEEGRPFPPERLPARAVFQGGLGEAALLLRYRVRGKGEERWSNVRAYPIMDGGGQIVQAINVFRDVTADHQAEERRKFVSRAVDELGSSLDYDATLAAVARLAVPVLADWCAVDVVEDGRPKRVATAHVDPTKIAAAEELERRYPTGPHGKSGVHEILRTGEAQLLSEIPRELILAAAVDADHLRLIDELDLRSYVGVPLKVGSKTLGAITLATAESRRVYTERDLAFAQALADRAALAIENARLFREVERARAATEVQLAAEAERRRQAEGASRFAEMFVGILGHDLRNPLNSVMMTAKLLQQKATGDGKAMARILSSAQRMSNMVTQLLDLTRIRLAGGIPVERRPVAVGMIVSDVVDELRRVHPEREIRWKRPNDEHALVDADRLAQVITNLVGNALQHGDPSKPITIALTASDGVTSVAVHNAGPPIPAEMHTSIFDPFRRTTTSDVRSTKGLGLGLFIAHEIVVAHGGRIDVRSTVGDGTMFTVTLPRVAEAERLAAPDKLLIR